MSNANRDYAIVYDVKNSLLTLSRPLVFYITDKNTSNIFVRLVTKTNIGNGVDQYTDIENALNYILIMRVIKPNDEVTSIRATQREAESIFEFDLTENFKDIPGIYMCELMRDKNYDWIKIVLAENYLPNKYLAGKSGRDQEVISNSKWVTNSVSLR